MKLKFGLNIFVRYFTLRIPEFKGSCVPFNRKSVSRNILAVMSQKNIYLKEEGRKLGNISKLLLTENTYSETTVESESFLIIKDGIGIYRNNYWFV